MGIAPFFHFVVIELDKPNSFTTGLKDWNEDKMEYISKRLKTLMKQRGISRKKLASDLNLKQEAIDQYQDNFYTADIETLILFSNYFNVSVDYLLQRTDQPKLKK